MPWLSITASAEGSSSRRTMTSHALSKVRLRLMTRTRWSTLSLPVNRTIQTFGWKMPASGFFTSTTVSSISVCAER